MAVDTGTRTEPPVELTVAVCQCRDCRLPRPANAATRDNHAMCHAEFALFLSERDEPTPGIAHLSPARLVEINAQEHDPSRIGACRNPVHAMYPRHPANPMADCR